MVEQELEIVVGGKYILPNGIIVVLQEGSKMLPARPGLDDGIVQMLKVVDGRDYGFASLAWFKKKARLVEKPSQAKVSSATGINFFRAGQFTTPTNYFTNATITFN